MDLGTRGADPMSSMSFTAKAFALHVTAPVQEKAQGVVFLAGA